MGLGYGTEWSFGAWLQDHNFHMTQVSSLPLYWRTNAARKQENGETMFKLNFIRKLALMGANVTRKRSGSGDRRSRIRNCRTRRKPREHAPCQLRATLNACRELNLTARATANAS